MKNKIGITICIIGIVFLINAIFGRYIVLPGYLESLGSENIIPNDVPIYKMVRYMIWAYSFKIGIFLFILGLLFWNNRSKKEKLLFSIVCIIYLGFAYMPLEFYSSLFFGISGGIVTIASLLLFWIMENKKYDKTTKNEIFEYLGLYFIIMGVYNICPFTGVRCFALHPEKMIEYNLQKDAYSFANHIMIEFTVGFLFLLFSRIKLKNK